MKSVGRRRRGKAGRREAEESALSLAFAGLRWPSPLSQPAPPGLTSACSPSSPLSPPPPHCRLSLPFTLSLPLFPLLPPPYPSFSCSPLFSLPPYSSTLGPEGARAACPTQQKLRTGRTFWAERGGSPVEQTHSPCPRPGVARVGPGTPGAERMVRVPPSLASLSPWQLPPCLALAPNRDALGLQPTSLPLVFPNPCLWILFSQGTRVSGPGAPTPSTPQAPPTSGGVPIPLNSAKGLHPGSPGSLRNRQEFKWQQLSWPHLFLLGPLSPQRGPRPRLPAPLPPSGDYGVIEAAHRDLLIPPSLCCKHGAMKIDTQVRCVCHSEMSVVSSTATPRRSCHFLLLFARWFVRRLSKAPNP